MSEENKIPTPIEVSKPKSTSPLIIFTAVVVSLFLALLIGIIASAVIYISWTPKAESTLTVEATSKKSVMPDTAVANFAYSQTGSDVQVLNIQADTTIEKINTYLSDSGINSADITSSKNSYPNYAYNPDGTYDQSQTVMEVNYTVTFNDIQNNSSKTNTIFDKLIGLGVNRFNGFQYSIKSTEDICKELDLEATKKAFENAQSKVVALDGGKIISREVLPGFGNCGQNIDYPMSMVGSQDSKAGDLMATPPDLSAGSQELTSTVQLKVVYR